ncbi:MAG: hypothetical protein FJ225_13595 [Lentisphaerae bacterium]|nr:hypothetical protein [Lentisphaerota bacterium]
MKRRISRHGSFARCALATVMVCGALLCGDAARSEGLKIDHAAIATRDAKTATITFDIAWSNSWRHGGFHDAAWVFFKVKPAGGAVWQPARLAADRVVTPTGFSQGKEGTPIEFVVPGGADGYVGLFVRRAGDGIGAVSARGVTVVCEAQPLNAEVRAFGVEMVYVAEGPFYLGSGGIEWNRLYRWTDGSKDMPLRVMGTSSWELHDNGSPTPPFRVTSSGAIPTGRENGKLWAAGIKPEDGGEIPASFPNGYAAFYGMKYPYITQGQYAGLLGTLTPTELRTRYYADYHGKTIQRGGAAPEWTFVAEKPYDPCPRLSYADGAAFAAWAGLRPMTELEFEKAIRGPLDPRPNEAGFSYWGLAWMGFPNWYDRPISTGSAAGRKFVGTHGRGTLDLPGDWPTEMEAVLLRYDPYYNSGALKTSGRGAFRNVFLDRSLTGCWRAARTAPAGDTAIRQAAKRFDPEGVKALPRLAGALRCDGVLDEWGAAGGQPEPTAILNAAEDVAPLRYRTFLPTFSYDPWRGPEDVSARLFLGHDGQSLCVAVEVTDDRHCNTQAGDKLWNGDALQVHLVNAKGINWSLALALTTNGVVMHQFSGPSNDVLKAASRAVARDDKARTTRYELGLPLAAIGVAAGEDFSLNMMVADGDDEKGMRAAVALHPSMEYPPIIARFPRFTVRK